MNMKLLKSAFLVSFQHFPSAVVKLSFNKRGKLIPS